MSNKKHNFDVIDVSLPVEGGQGYKLTLNGMPVRGVKSLSFNSAVGKCTEVTLTFFANVNYMPDEPAAETVPVAPLTDDPMFPSR